MLSRTMTILLLLMVGIPGSAQNLTIQTKSPLYNGSVSDTYDLQFLASGGTPPYTWAVTSGALPSGLGLNSTTGLLSGTPMATGHSAFTIQVTDSAKKTKQKNFGLSVLAADNRYCNAGNAVNFAGATTDGVANLPQSCFYTIRASTPSPGATCAAHSASDLSGILAGTLNCKDSKPLQCGDTILLDAGTVYGGHFTFPAKGCDDKHYITVKSTGVKDSRWAAEGARINPCYAGVSSLPGRPDYSQQCPGGAGQPVKLMAQLLLTATSGSGPIDLGTNNADHYRFIGVEITRQSAPATTIVDLVTVGQGHNIILDQVWCHGVEPGTQSGNFPEDQTNFTETARCLSLGQSNHVAVINSYLNDFYCTGSFGTSCDAQAIGGGTGTVLNTGWGTYKVVNNLMEGAAETIEIGGGPGPNTGGGIDSPADFEVRRNHMFKPILEWMPPSGAKGAGWPVVKNLYEMKNGQRALLEGNLLQNVWAGFSQVGAVFLLTPKSQAGKNGSNLCPFCVVTDITIRYNFGTTAAQTFQIGNVKSDNGGFALAGNHYSIHDNVIDNLLYTGCFACGANTVATAISEAPDVPTSDVLQYVSLNHNTITQANPGLGTQLALIGLSGAMVSTGNNMSNITFTNNLGEQGLNGTYNTKGGGDTTNCAFHQQFGLNMINACWNPYTFGGNAIVANTKTTWPGTNCLTEPSFDSIFVNYNNGFGGDYHVKSTSPCHNSATDMIDPGANIDLVNSYTASVP